MSLLMINYISVGVPLSTEELSETPSRKIYTTRYTCGDMSRVEFSFSCLNLTVK